MLSWDKRIIVWKPESGLPVRECMVRGLTDLSDPGIHASALISAHHIITGPPQKCHRAVDKRRRHTRNFGYFREGVNGMTCCAVMQYLRTPLVIGVTDVDVKPRVILFVLLDG